MKVQPISFEIITPAANYPVTLAEAKEHLRVDHTDEDSSIWTMISAATVYVENYTGLSLIARTVEARYEKLGNLLLPSSPIISITSITTSEGVMETTVYDLVKGKPPHITLKKDQRWPVVDDRSIYVRYVAGYEDSGASPQDLADNIPTPLKQSVLLMVGNMYENRENVALVNGGKYEANPTIKYLMNPYRVNMGL
jgi:uncharacterized phiE125 gp8 family phage protein